MAPRSTMAAWLPVALWIGVIAWLGGGGFEHGQTSRIIGPLLAWLFPDWSPEQVAAAHGVIRKLAHVVEYAVLGGLAVRALWLTRPPAPAWRRALPALALVALVASADEGRQAMLSGRTGSLRDVGLDCAGGLAGAAAMPVLMRLRRRPGGRDG